ncbi:MAG: extracellular solute-binding protein [Roseibium sp.]|uniref:extracellular solute-binding protein n=1 Tax=Roseibium sp. TaxID=1936156 RepID=UPI00261DA4BC|nr:extracellular solute-binding protein [Roseibium sp.]MCV0424190.1 extracellular solute-binding protein [Roseibium sp.]
MANSFIRALLGGVTAIACVGSAAAGTGNLVIYNWSDYLDPAVIEAFEAETGIKVTYDTYDSNAILETKVLAGGSGYDIIVPSSNGAARLIEAGMLRKIDKEKIPNLEHVWPKISRMIETFDPGNEYLVPYNWWTFGVAYNTDMLNERLGPDFPKSWDLLLDPKISSTLAACNILIVDSPVDVLGAALIDLGLDPNTTDKGEISAAGEHVGAVRENIAQISADGVVAALSNGDACLGLTWSGDAYWAAEGAKEAGNGVKLDFFIPQEGTLLDLDCFAILNEAKNVDEAHAFLNFLMQPSVAAQNANFIRYGSANLTAQSGIERELLDNPAVYPTDKTFERLTTPVVQDRKTERFYTRTWSKVRTGQ